MRSDPRESEGHDGHCGLAAARSDQAAAVTEEKIFDVVGAVIRIDDGSLWIVAHAAGAEKMDTELLLVNRIVPFLFCASSVEEFHRTVRKPMGEFEVVGMILVGEPKRGKSPGVL